MTNKKSPFRVGLIGCGNMAGHHALVLKALGASLAAVCGRPGSQRARKFARRFKIPKVATSWQEVAADPAVDALWVTTPWDVTGKILLPLLQASKPVFLEKPAALESGTIEQALRIQRRSGIPVAVGMNRRFYDFIPKLQGILKTHALKSVVVNLPEKFTQRSSRFLSLQEPWFFSSIHEIDLLFHLLGKLRIRASYPRSSRNGHSPGFHGLLEGGPDRVPIHLVCTWGTPWNKGIRFFFDDFVVELSPIEKIRIFEGVREHQPTAHFQITRYTPIRKEERWTQSIRYKPGIYAQDRAVLDWMRSGKSPKGIATLKEACAVTRFIEEILFTSTGGPHPSEGKRKGPLRSKAFLKGLMRIPHVAETRLGLDLMDRNERTSDFPPETVQEIRNLVTPFLLRAYPEPEPFYNQLARWLGVSREKVLVAAGADGALRSVFETFVEPGDEVVHAIPSYAMIPVYCSLSGAVSKPLFFQKDLTLPLERVLRAITPRTKIVLLVNPNQPIERLYDESECRRLLEQCRRRGALLVMDEVYHHFCEATALPLLKEYDNLAVVRTFSKAFGVAGLRLGYLVSSARNVREISKVRPMYEANSFALAVGSYLLKNDHLMKSYVQQVKESRSFLLEAMRGLKIPAYGRWSNSVVLALPPDMSALGVGARLQQRGFMVRVETTPPLSNHLKVTVGPLDQARRFLEAFENVLSPQPVNAR